MTLSNGTRGVASRGQVLRLRGQKSASDSKMSTKSNIVYFFPTWPITWAQA